MEKEPEKIIFGWWKDLENARKKIDERGNRLKTPFTTGDSARIRACKSIDEVILDAPVLYNLQQRLEGTSWQNLERVALVAGVLSHIRENRIEKDKPCGVPFELAEIGKKDNRQLEKTTKLRFQRLIQLKTPDELFLPMIRMVKYLKYSTQVSYLAKGLYCWASEQNDPRKRWAIDFYTALTQ